MRNRTEASILNHGRIKMNQSSLWDRSERCVIRSLYGRVQAFLCLQMRNEDHFTRLAGKYFDTQSLKLSLLVRIGAVAYNLLCLRLSSC